MFLFCFSFSLLFLLFKSFCIFVKSTWPRGAIDCQLSLDWPRGAIAPRNMAPSLTRLRRIQWCSSLFLFLRGNNHIWANLVQKIKIISLNWNLVPTLIRTCRIQWWNSLFLFLIGSTFFEKIWSKNSKLWVEAEIWYLD